MTKVVVYHRFYGCATGCCGHAIYVDDEETLGSLRPGHPYDEDPQEWAKQFVRETLGAEHVADLDWDNCFVSKD